MTCSSYLVASSQVATCREVKQTYIKSTFHYNLLGRHICIWENNIKMEPKEIGWKLWTAFIWLMKLTSDGSEPLGSIKDGKVLTE
jgi:hypothetical protein